MGGQKRSPEEQMALEQMKAETERANQFWQQAQGDVSKARGFYAPIAGGSRQAATEAMAPEIQGATQRMDAGRTSLLNMSGRSGGAAQQIDPYAKGAAATDILTKARPAAAQGMLDIGKTVGSWAGQQGQGMAGMAEQGRLSAEDQAKKGAGFFDVMNRGINTFGDWWNQRRASKTPTKSAGFSDWMNSGGNS
jgi:hypothetical protein